MNYKERIWKEKPAKDRYIDFTGCKTLGEIHLVIKEILELPDFYGENLDALWDSVTGLMYWPANIKIKKGGASELSQEIEKIIEVFKEAKEEYGDITVTVLEADK